jgi:hypothetical protein
MMKELKEILKEGGMKVLAKYSVSVGDNIWNSIDNYIDTKLPADTYSIDSVCEEEGQKFAVLHQNAEDKYYRLNFALSENEEFVPEDTLIEITSIYSKNEEAPQFAEADVEAYYANKKN